MDGIALTPNWDHARYPLQNTPGPVFRMPDRHAERDEKSVLVMGMAAETGVSAETLLIQKNLKENYTLIDSRNLQKTL